MGRGICWLGIGARNGLRDAGGTGAPKNPPLQLLDDTNTFLEVSLMAGHRHSAALLPAQCSTALLNVWL